MVSQLKNSQMGSPRTLFLLYEDCQIRELERLWREHPEEKIDSLVVALDKGVEFLLEEAHVPFRSAHDYRQDVSFSLYLLAEEWALKIFQNPRWAFFCYRQVPFTKVFFPALLAHIQRMLYFTNIFSSIVETHPASKRIVVFPSLVVTSATTAYLARREADLPIECLKAVAKGSGHDVIVHTVALAPYKRSAKIDTITFSLKRAIFGALLSFWNVAIKLLRSTGRPRIFVSDYWRSLEPILQQLVGGEVILFDRGEALKAGIPNMWRYRMRFFHFEGFSIRRSDNERERTKELFKEEWQKMRTDTTYLSECAVQEYPLRQLLVEVLGDIVNRAVAHTLAEVDGAYALLGTLKPDVILLRATASAQTHFSSLAYVGKALGIPAIELQHGIEYNGPGSGGVTRFTAEYKGVYGRFVQKEFTKGGFSSKFLPLIGSPRFDVYAGMKENIPEQSNLRVLCIGPETTLGDHFDTYAVSDYFKSIAAAVQKTPGATLTIKLRTTRRESFYRTAIAQTCQQVPYTIVRDESLHDLFRNSDVVISYYSTAILESLQCGKPTIILGLLSLEAEAMRSHFSPYVETGALAIATNETELSEAFLHLKNDVSAREKMSSAARTFIEQNYSFDGKASERIVELIKRLATKDVGVL